MSRNADTREPGAQVTRGASPYPGPAGRGRGTGAVDDATQDEEPTDVEPAGPRGPLRREGPFRDG